MGVGLPLPSCLRQGLFAVFLFHPPDYLLCSLAVPLSLPPISCRRNGFTDTHSLCPAFFVESEDSDSGILEGLVGGKTGRNAVIVISEMYKKLKTYKSDPCPFAAVLYAC